MNEVASEKIAEELQSVVGALVRRMRAVSPERELSLSQVSVLKRLDRDGPATIADLARADKLRHQSMAATVTALVDRGLLRRTADSADLRRKLLTLTDDGRALLAERRATGHEHLADLIADRLTAAERKQVATSLALLRRLLD
ncbi:MULTISPECIES: MarR family transcriptional regulator [unclassified Nocardia]|uniref:MarR family winged helix-turn-helix transcriptional regulator n=1 Tax=unclassified Nocardia TaxID=2637762 RepID=UPI001CE448C5|nr:MULTISPECIES: MarR family transcriptional regulator [unclassified Nocardia]